MIKKENQDGNDEDQYVERANANLNTFREVVSLNLKHSCNERCRYYENVDGITKICASIIRDNPPQYLGNYKLNTFRSLVYWLYHGEQSTEDERLSIESVFDRYNSNSSIIDNDAEGNSESTMVINSNTIMADDHCINDDAADDITVRTMDIDSHSNMADDLNTYDSDDDLSYEHKCNEDCQYYDKIGFQECYQCIVDGHLDDVIDHLQLTYLKAGEFFRHHGDLSDEYEIRSFNKIYKYYLLIFHQSCSAQPYADISPTVKTIDEKEDYEIDAIPHDDVNDNCSVDVQHDECNDAYDETSMMNTMPPDIVTLITWCSPFINNINYHNPFNINIDNHELSIHSIISYVNVIDCHKFLYSYADHNHYYHRINFYARNHKLYIYHISNIINLTDWCEFLYSRTNNQYHNYTINHKHFILIIFPQNCNIIIVKVYDNQTPVKYKYKINSIVKFTKIIIRFTIIQFNKFCHIHNRKYSDSDTFVLKSEYFNLFSHVNSLPCKIIISRIINSHDYLPISTKFINKSSNSNIIIYVFEFLILKLMSKVMVMYCLIIVKYYDLESLINYTSSSVELNIYIKLKSDYKFGMICNQWVL